VPAATGGQGGIRDAALPVGTAPLPKPVKPPNPLIGMQGRWTGTWTCSAEGAGRIRETEETWTVSLRSNGNELPRGTLTASLVFETQYSTGQTNRSAKTLADQCELSLSEGDNGTASAWANQCPHSSGAENFGMVLARSSSGALIVTQRGGHPPCYKYEGPASIELRPN
jgi:hypothetical protein